MPVYEIKGEVSILMQIRLRAFSVGDARERASKKFLGAVKVSIPYAFDEELDICEVTEVRKVGEDVQTPIE